MPIALGMSYHLLYLASTVQPYPKGRSSRSYASNPWFAGRPVVPGPTHSTELLEVHFSSLPVKHIARNWIVHNDPRLVRISRKDLQEQLLGAAILDHELGCVILRRLKHPLSSDCDHDHDHELGCLTMSDCAQPGAL
ncbi:hypothetical protein VPH35_122456 [Triticum aestivum]